MSAPVRRSSSSVPCIPDQITGAFDKSDLPWSGCVHEDRCAGALVIVTPTIPVARMVTVPDRLRTLVRRHNHASCDAAQIQLRVAMHIGSIHHDGQDSLARCQLPFRPLDARTLKRMLSGSDAGGRLDRSIGDEHQTAAMATR